jgi:hypothetical protein
MTRNTIRIILLFLMITFSQTSFAAGCDTLKPGQAAFFQHSKFEGTCVVRNMGNYANAKAIGIGNDKISSIRMAPGTQVRLCSDSNFRGRCETYTTSMASIAKMNDKTSSAIVGKIPPPARTPPAKAQSANCDPKANQVAFFQHANYQGACSIRNVGLYANSKSIGMGNDKISSVKIGSGINVELCSDSNFKGCTSYSKSMPSLGKMNDKTSSARIVRTVPPKSENVPLISTDDCLAYGGIVVGGSDCASGRHCILNNVNACTSNVKATTKD